MSKASFLKINQVKYGAILSYLLIVANSLQGLFMAPYILSQVGDGNYGVYKTIAAFSATIMVMDLGIGTTVMRYTAKFRAEKKTEEISNFAAMGLIEATIMAVFAGILSVAIYFYLPTFYSESFTADEISLARTLFCILAVNIIFVIIENVFNGVITGCNRFVFANGTKLCLLLLRIVANVALLQMWKSAVVLVGITLACSVVTMVLQLLYIRTRLNIRIRLYRWDLSLFKESLGYTLLMFAQTIAVQANGNIDNIVISYVIGPAAVTVYSFGIQLFNMYESLATAFSGLMLPNISKRIADGADNVQLQETVTKVGRMQFAILGAALAGFICLGQEFITLWLGDEFEDVYVLSLIMMIPVTFTLVQNVCLSILRARNMMKFRTGSLICTTILNLILTVVGTKLYGYYAAAIGTGLSVVLGSIIAMNIYYHKRIGFKVFKFYFDVFRRLIVCVFVPSIVVVLMKNYCELSWIWLLFQIVLFMVIYAVMLWFYGFNIQEKRYLWKGYKEKNESK